MAKRKWNERINRFHLYLNYLLLHRKISDKFQKRIQYYSASNSKFHHPHPFGHSWSRMNVRQVVVHSAIHEFGNLNQQQTFLSSSTPSFYFDGLVHQYDHRLSSYFRIEIESLRTRDWWKISFVSGDNSADVRTEIRSEDMPYHIHPQKSRPRSKEKEKWIVECYSGCL